MIDVLGPKERSRQEKIAARQHGVTASYFSGVSNLGTHCCGRRRTGCFLPLSLLPP